MMLPAANRALRREVTRLAALPVNDLEAILDELDPSQRRRVEELLREFLRPSGEASQELAVSPWLAERIDGSLAGPTPRTRTVMKTAAEALTPLSSEPRERGRTLLDHVASAFSFGRRRP